MCYNYEVEDKPVAGKYRYTKKTEEFTPGNQNGFTHPIVPVVTNRHPENVQFYHWGLLPHWAKDNSRQKQTLNARIETIHEKPSFRSSTDNRCLVLATAFYEWQWLDPKGKNKQKFRIWKKDSDLFCFAGLFSDWVDKTSGKVIPTFTILTREAQGIMREIHNNKLRMPVILLPEEEEPWLAGTIEIPTIPVLEAEKI